MNLPLPNQFTPERYEIVDTEQVRFLRRELGKPDLFMYRHRVHQNFVVCYWLNKDDGWFIELLILSKPQAMTKECVDTLREWSSGSGPSMKQIRQQLWADQREQIRKAQEDEDEARQAKKWLNKRCRREGHPDTNNPTFDVNLRARPGGQ